MNDDIQIFIDAVRADDSIPLAFREQVSAVQGFERKIFDQSYLEFLREQIALGARGPEWTALLAERLAVLSPYCDLPTLSGSIRAPEGYCFVRVDPISRRIIRHEESESTESAR